MKNSYLLRKKGRSLFIRFIGKRHGRREAESLLDKRKIRIMTALAIYDKYYGEKDRKIEGYYKRDFIYKKNSITRLGIMVGFCILFGLYGMSILFSETVDLMSYPYMQTAYKAGGLLVVLLIAYTVLGNCIYGKEYENAEERLKNYRLLLRLLDNHKGERETNHNR